MNLTPPSKKPIAESTPEPAQKVKVRDRIIVKNPLGPDSVYMKRFWDSFDAAGNANIFGDWAGDDMNSIDSKVERALSIIRSRSREAALNNPYVFKYLRILESNVVGPKGIRLKMNVVNRDGTSMETANEHIENDWHRFCKTVTVNGMSMVDLQRYIIKTVARDGEVFLIKVNSGPFNVQYKIRESDWCPHRYNQTLERDKKYIRNGIEYDMYGLPVAYYFSKINPKDFKLLPSGAEQTNTVRYEASEVIHLMRPDYSYQGRGYPWSHAALTTIYQHKEYTFTEQVAARVAAAKMAFILKGPDSDGLEGTLDEEGIGPTVDSPHQATREVSPGTIEELANGDTVQVFDPKHPMTTFEQFQRAILQTVASGLDVSYATLTSDYSMSNFSSARVALLEERDAMRILQDWMIEHLLNPIFEKFLENNLLFRLGETPYPIEQYEKFNRPVWMPRTWQWVDPQKEMTAIEKEINLHLRSRSDVMRQLGRDPEQQMREIAREMEMMRQLGITPEQVDSAIQQQVVEPEPEEGEDDTDNDDTDN